MNKTEWVFRTDEGRECIKDELLTLQEYQIVHKDILIVVHNQLDYVKNCIESVQKNTSDFTLWVWDNGSDESTQQYLRSLDCQYIRREENEGFIVPNNMLAAWGKSPFLILLNSDTVVERHWDEAMIAFLQKHRDVAEVGYEGVVLDVNGKGCRAMTGYLSPYIAGWCVCLPRRIYEEFGLFDEQHLDFAYGEDADLSFRLRERGYKVYALATDFAKHFQNKTVQSICQNKDWRQRMANNLDRNLAYIRQRWPQYCVGASQ